MKPGFRVKLLKMTSGERFPLLLDREGQPLFETTVYTITELRARNHATNTISNALRAIQLFYMFLSIRGIDLSSRLSSGQLLSLGEIEDLARLCRFPLGQLDGMMPDSAGAEGQDKVTSLEKVRMRLREGEQKEVDPTFAGSRVRYIRAYIEWLVSERLSGSGMDARGVDRLHALLGRVLSALTARIPKRGAISGSHQREGLAPKSVAELLRVVSPDAPDNPWRVDYVRYRNELIVHWLLHLGLRRGELLGVRIPDINFHAGTVTIHRCADDLADPRTNQPQTKTKAREIPLSEGLKSLTYTYVMNHRPSLAGAKKHDFLFCADVMGRPMSLPALNKVFNTLRTKSSSLPDSLSPHVLRHTWNDRFSGEMDKRNIKAEKEMKIRAYLMGWSETSGTAATYTRRHTRKKAQEASLKMQERMMREYDNA